MPVRGAVAAILAGELGVGEAILSLLSRPIRRNDHAAFVLTCLDKPGACRAHGRGRRTASCVSGAVKLGGPFLRAGDMAGSLMILEAGPGGARRSTPTTRTPRPDSGRVDIRPSGHHWPALAKTRPGRPPATALRAGRKSRAAASVPRGRRIFAAFIVRSGELLDGYLTHARTPAGRSPPSATVTWPAKAVPPAIPGTGRRALFARTAWRCRAPAPGSADNLADRGPGREVFTVFITFTRVPVGGASSRSV
jgi:hypothetical protein